MLQGAGHNVALIMGVLGFWAVVQWRALAGWLIGVWRRWRAPAETGISPDRAEVANPVGQPQVRPSLGLSGQGSGTGSGEGSRQGQDRLRTGLGEASGEGVRRLVETLPNGTTGVWIKGGAPVLAPHEPDLWGHR